MGKKHRSLAPDPAPVSRVGLPKNSRALCISTNVQANSGAGFAEGHSWLDLYEGRERLSFDSYPDGRTMNSAVRTDSDVRMLEHNMYMPRSEYCVEIGDAQLDRLLEAVSQPTAGEHLHNCTSWAADTFNAVTGAEVDVDDGWFFGVENPRSLADEIQRLKTLHRESGSSIPSGRHRGWLKD